MISESEEYSTGTGLHVHSTTLFHERYIVTPKVEWERVDGGGIEYHFYMMLECQTCFRRFKVEEKVA